MNRDYEKIIAEYEQRFGNKDNDIIYAVHINKLKHRTKPLISKI